ncbi:hypothetical protein [Tellurirhabdus bombi]|uniref:hypothetical protein n=1 Tax=Tellurirhabdus bombi TaxID=2907205 RepID=UPI001F3CF563|nr:hypothetical protein [Tellurirhabdus bombi]
MNFSTTTINDLNRQVDKGYLEDTLIFLDNCECITGGTADFSDENTLKITYPLLDECESFDWPVGPAESLQSILTQLQTEMEHREWQANQDAMSLDTERSLMYSY